MIFRINTQYILKSINRLVLAIEMQYVFFEVGSQFLNIV
jgi:hypothetical protein